MGGLNSCQQLRSGNSHLLLAAWAAHVSNAVNSSGVGLALA